MELINYLSSDGDFAGSSSVKQPSRAETPVSLVCATNFRVVNPCMGGLPGGDAP